MKYLTLFAVLAALTVPAAFANAASSAKNTVLIRHQMAHCHAWSFDGGRFAAAISGTIAKPGKVTFTDNDVMPHRLIETGGPAAVFEGSALLNHMGASVTVTFPKPGIYRFATKPGEDYMKGVVTTGADNVLSLEITVK